MKAWLIANVSRANVRVDVETVMSEEMSEENNGDQE